MLKNIGANWMLTLLSILSAFILMPYTIRVLGSEEYGLWILVASATGYLSLLVLGTPMASVRFLSKSIAEKDYGKVNEIVGGFAGLYLMLGLLCLAVGAIIYALFPVLFNVPAEHTESAQRALVIVVFSIAGGFIGRLPGAVFAAHQDFVIRNVILAAAVVLRLVLTLVLLDLAPSIITVAIIQLIHILFEFLVSTYVMHRTYPEIHLSFKKFETGTLNHEGLAGVEAAVEFVADIGKQFGDGFEHELKGVTGRRRNIVGGLLAFEKYEQTLTKYLLGELARVPELRLYGPPPGYPRTSTISFTYTGYTPRIVAEYLDSKGVFVWDGDFFATTLVERLGLMDEGGLIRIGISPYNTKQELRRVTELLKNKASLGEFAKEKVEKRTDENK